MYNKVMTFNYFLTSVITTLIKVSMSLVNKQKLI